MHHDLLEIRIGCILGLHGPPELHPWVDEVNGAEVHEVEVFHVGPVLGDLLDMAVDVVYALSTELESQFIQAWWFKESFDN
jgi:hypothetical protein